MPSPISGTYNGLAFGAGTALVVDRLAGWLGDLPDVRTTDVDKAQDQGQYVGLDLSSERTVALDLVLMGRWSSTGDFAAFTALLDQVVAAFTLGGSTELPLVINDSVRNRLANGRVRRRKLPEGLYAAQRPNAKVAVEFDCSDPRIYDAAQSQGTTGIGTSGTGFTFPYTFPFTFGAGATGNTFQANNTGSFPTNPVATIQGPATNPGIQNVTLGLSVIVNITLGATDSLVIDFNARTITLNGQASRRNALDPSSRWWSLNPGVNAIKFLGSGGSGGTLLTLAWRSAWL